MFNSIFVCSYTNYYLKYRQPIPKKKKIVTWLSSINLYSLPVTVEITNHSFTAIFSYITYITAQIANTAAIEYETEF